MVPIGLVSVIPQAWATLTPAFINRSSMKRGAAEPPMIAWRKCGSVTPVASICWKVASQTVGTPAEWVTFSRFIRSHSTAGSLTAENTNLTPAAAPHHGKPQLAAWNIGTTGSMTLRASKSNIAGCTPVIA